MPALDLRTMEELFQPTMNGRGGPIAPLPDESLFEAWERYKLSIDRCLNHNMLPVTQIDTFYNELTLRHRDTINAAAGGTFMKRRPEECYDLIENMTAHHNDWDTSSHRDESSNSTTSSSSEIAALAQQMIEMRKDMLQMYRSNQQVNYVTHRCETCGGPHSYYECQAADGYTQDVYATTGNYNPGGNAYQPQGDRNLLSYRSNNFLGPPGNQYRGNNQNFPNNQNRFNQGQGYNQNRAGPSVPPPFPSSSKEVERDPETITDHVLTESTTRVPPSVVQPSPISRPFKIPPPPTSYSSELRKRNHHKPLIPYPSSLAEALALMPKYHKMLKDLLSNKEKLLGLANTCLTENCSAVLLKKLPEKLRDPGKFLIPCDFPKLEKCMALADLGASINLMPLSVWKKLMLRELVPTHMTLELANRSIAYPAGIAKDVFVQVGKFTFLANFVVVDKATTLGEAI
ncbi:reverse transcriptase domain-containing protein [Tanacetum coccineum]